MIGHSGAGKSACLLALGLDRKAADMDAVLGTSQSPPLERVLRWLATDNTAPRIVVVSNHEQMLIEMRNAKSTGQHLELFSAVYFVYLRKPKDQLKCHLALPSAGGSNRDEASQRYTLDNYDRFDTLFTELSKKVVDCSDRTIESVAAEIRSLEL